MQETRLRRTMDRRLVAVATAVAGVAGLLSAVSCHHGCTDPGPPVARPAPSSARAAYCHFIHGSHPWLQFSLGAMFIVLAAGLMVSYKPRLYIFIILVVIILLITLAGLANSLEYSVTI